MGDMAELEDSAMPEKATMDMQLVANEWNAEYNRLVVEELQNKKERLVHDTTQPPYQPLLDMFINKQR